MEILDGKINKFLFIETGYGSGSGDGYGDGYGSGSGDGIKSIDGQEVYLIDGIETIITLVKGDVAKGFILNKDLTLSPCFICKGENQFAHGENLHEANQALQAKLLKDKPISERINMFKEQFPDFNKSYKNMELYNWHHILTGSCKMGRDSFAADRGIDIKNGSMTINKFIELTKNSFGGEIINQLKQ